MLASIKALRLSFLFGMMAGLASAQQTIGTVGAQDASTTGMLEVADGKVHLTGSSTVTAKDRTAEVQLSRGGKVSVCATSTLHLASGKTPKGIASLILGLDHGAIELQTSAVMGDGVMTPDLRIGLGSDGPLDLRLRVTKNGDTCVENRPQSPDLFIMDQFGETSYTLRGGQHVLFEHGNLKEVVDRETSSCGCPPPTIFSVADAGVSSSRPAAPGSLAAAKQAEEQHPFPAAVSLGLAPAPPVPAVPPGEIHTQVAATLSYSAPTGANSSADASPAFLAATNAKSPAPSSKSALGSSSVPQAPTTVLIEAKTPPPAAPPSVPDLAHRIGHFFKRLFGKG